MFAAVVAIDQAAKWWAWNNSDTTHINSGGGQLVSTTVSSWFADPARGAVLDALDVAVLALIGAALWRTKTSRWFVIPALVAVAGWSSNLLDRLGLHYLTAPGAVRGVVDFIPIGGHYYNVADLFIISATVVAGLAGFILAGRRVLGPARPPAAAPRGDLARGTAMPVSHRLLAAASLTGAVVAAVTVGSLDYGGVTANVWLLAAH